MEEPPSVAAATDAVMIDEDDAVWKESMVMIESVGVGPWGPVALGREVRSSDPFGFGEGRMVRMEERDGASFAGACGRTTVVE